MMSGWAEMEGTGAGTEKEEVAGAAATTWRHHLRGDREGGRGTGREGGGMREGGREEKGGDREADREGGEREGTGREGRERGGQRGRRQGGDREGEREGGEDNLKVTEQLLCNNAYVACWVQ